MRPASPTGTAGNGGTGGTAGAAGPVDREGVTAGLAARLGSAAEARWLVEHVAGPGARSGLGEAERRVLAALADRRLAGEPLQYLFGTWAFRNLELAVDPRALIPRPETEQVVEVALVEVRRMAGRRAGGHACAVDLGTGTGAVALSLAVELAPELPGLSVWATDVDPDALALAAENRSRVARHRPAAGLDRRVHLGLGSWFVPLPRSWRGRIDVVVANPPYVAEAEWPSLDPEVHREPRRALLAGPGSDGTPGLAAVEEVLAGSRGWLAPTGAAVVELAPHQAAAAAGLARRLGYAEVTVGRDLAGRDRAVVART